MFFSTKDVKEDLNYTQTTSKGLKDAINLVENDETPDMVVFNAWVVTTAKLSVGIYLKFVFNTWFLEKKSSDSLKFVFVSPTYKIVETMFIN